MKDLKITYTDQYGISVTLTRDEDTDIMSGEPNSCLKDDLASIVMRLVKESGVGAADFYETLRNDMEYECEGFKEYLEEMEKINTDND